MNAPWFLLALPFFPIDYESNFPNLPDEPLSKEDLETTSVPKNSEPTQALLSNIDGTDLPKPFTQDNADPGSGNTPTVSPQTEVGPTFPSEKQPVNVDATRSLSDQPPTGTNAWHIKHTMLVMWTIGFD